MKTTPTEYVKNLKLRTVVLAIAFLLVIVGGAIVVINNHNKPTPHVAKSTGPGRFAGINAQVNQKIDAQQVFLEMYKTNNSEHYPAELSPEVFSQQPGISGDISYVFAPPPGFKFAYTALPAGCTTAANNCTDFILLATDLKGKIVYKVNSANIAQPAANAKSPR